MADMMLKTLAKVIRIYRKTIRLGNKKIKGIFSDDYDYPEQINVEVSTACNYNCKMCSLQKFHPNKTNINPKIFTMIDEVLRKVNSISFGFTGETLMHKDFIKILRYIKKKYPYIHTAVVTNGSLLTEKIAQELVTLRVDHLSISLDATNKKDYEQIRRGGKWDLVMKNIKRLNEIKNKQKTDKPALATNFVAFKDNIDELPKFVTFVHKLGFSSIRMTNVEPYTKEMEKKTLFEKNFTPKVKDILEKTKKICKEHNIDFQHPKFSKVKNKIGCDFLEPYITLQGDVIPCGQFTYERISFIDGKKIKHPYISFGNIKSQSFDEIYYSSSYTTFRKKLKSGKWPTDFCKKHCLLNDEVLCPK